MTAVRATVKRRSGHQTWGDITTVRRGQRARIRRIPRFPPDPGWDEFRKILRGTSRAVLAIVVESDQTSPWRWTWATAAARDGTPSLPRRLETWVATVFGLMYSSAAISRSE